jgi:Protein of unknown function (DUF3300)
MNWPKQSFSLLISGSLVLATSQTGWAAGAEQSTAPPAVQTTLPSPDVLNQLVAPIALYPDSLVAQILAASTLPSEVVQADRWIKQHSALRGQAVGQAVNQQAWDPSVKALTQFPLVLANMDNNLSWSTQLGVAYASEPQNVLDAIQVMRRRAQQAGHLTGNSHETVTNEGDTIVIQPADAETVYVPEYNPWLVYGAPVGVYPGWEGVPGLFVTEPDVLFGLGIGIGAIAAFGWGWNHWGADWRDHRVAFNHGAYRPHREGFAGHAGFRGAGMSFAHGGFHGAGTSFAHAGGFAGGRGFNRGGVAGGMAARGGMHSGGAFHVAAGGFHGGGFHGGGGHGGGRR